MQSRRQLLQTIAVGAGACAIPTLGFANTDDDDSISVMGVDQWGSKWVCAWRDKAADLVIDILPSKNIIRNLSRLMESRGIFKCVVDYDPDASLVNEFAALYPHRVALCRWRTSLQEDTIEKVYGRGLTKRTVHMYNHGRVLELAEYSNTPDRVLAHHNYWVNPKHDPRVRHARALLLIALEIRDA